MDSIEYQHSDKKIDTKEIINELIDSVKRSQDVSRDKSLMHQ